MSSSQQELPWQTAQWLSSPLPLPWGQGAWSRAAFRILRVGRATGLTGHPAPHTPLGLPDMAFSVLAAPRRTLLQALNLNQGVSGPLTWLGHTA